jgi:protein arginine kinase activator
MKCAFCSEPATVHITDLSGGKCRELHLCEGCSAKEQPGTLAPKLNPQEFEIVKGIIAAADELAGKLAKLTCPHCGIKYIEFRVKGRLGCPADYDVFERGLLPLLQRIHGSTEHHGKRPQRGRAAGPESELARLRRELQAAVKSEQYEEAARLRDLIRAKESGDESQ